MDKETNRNVKLGIFVIMGIILFVVGIFFIGSKDNMFTKNIRISAVFHNTGGLAQGNYVHYNGVKVPASLLLPLLRWLERTYGSRDLGYMQMVGARKPA